MFKQNRSDYQILFIDDASEYTRAQKKFITEKLKGHIIQFNKDQRFSLRNAYEAIHNYIENDDAIIINLDGDDWLIRDDVIQIINDTYNSTSCLLTYGNCIYYAPHSKDHLKVVDKVIPTINHRYPLEVEKQNSYRKQYFRPLHIRTWKVGHFKKIPKKYFLRPDQTWIEMCEDQAMFLPMLEISEGQYQIITNALSAYNQANPLSDHKIYRIKQLIDEVIILKKPVLKI